ncbi:hypothetical protein C2G38_1439339 [Gigaspora rosea]|uniref:Uncharacterized protein n=1 Tax=Gigaspora rosea TaxID=44941 RepID=A0A397V5P5_9GLOM|nr:hypothetical protein C2G38_1439339 [Gigaspora rosea]
MSFASAQWNKILTHDAFPEHKIKLKEPHLCDKTVQQYSGYLDVNNGKHLFFWFFESRNNPKEDPVLIWLRKCSNLTYIHLHHISYIIYLNL